MLNWIAHALTRLNSILHVRFISQRPPVDCLRKDSNQPHPTEEIKSYCDQSHLRLTALENVSNITIVIIPNTQTVIPAFIRHLGELKTISPHS